MGDRLASIGSTDVMVPAVAATAKPLWLRVKNSMTKTVTDSSNDLWMSVFRECDLDNDGQLTLRELLVLIKRLGLDIPSEEELAELVSELDEDENGLIARRRDSNAAS